MEYRKLGNSGLQVSALSFGTWLTFGKQIDDKTADSLLSVAYENGVNFFDGAEVYARGKAEEVLGKILKSKDWSRSSYIVSSKVFFGWEKDLPNQRGLSRKHIFEACDAALKRFGLNYLDLFFCHRPDKNTPIEETVQAMNTLIQQGKILYWGTSEWSGVEIALAHYYAAKNGLIGPLMEQPQYNMFEREKMEKDYQLLFRDFKMGTTIWSPLASGLLSGKYNNASPQDTRLFIEGMDWLKNRTLAKDRIEKAKRLGQLADRLEIPMPHLGLAWCLKNPNVSTVILGASKVDQLKQNLQAFEVLPRLTDKVMNSIENILRNKPVLPEY